MATEETACWLPCVLSCWLSDYLHLSSPCHTAWAIIKSPLFIPSREPHTDFTAFSVPPRSECRYTSKPLLGAFITLEFPFELERKGQEQAETSCIRARPCAWLCIICFHSIQCRCGWGKEEWRIKTFVDLYSRVEDQPLFLFFDKSFQPDHLQPYQT